MVSNVPTTSHDFNYRSPRIELRLPVEFRSGATTLVGFTHNVSDDGFLVNFAEPVLAGSAGKATFRFGHCTLELQAHVTHSEGFCAGLTFEFSSEQERAFLYAIVQFLTRDTPSVA